MIDEDNNWFDSAFSPNLHLDSKHKMVLELLLNLEMSVDQLLKQKDPKPWYLTLIRSR